MQLLGNRVLIELSKEETTTPSGFVVVKDKDQLDVHEGTIFSVGTGRANEHGVWQTPSLVIGQKVLFNYGTSVTIEGKQYIMVNEADVLLVL